MAAPARILSLNLGTQTVGLAEFRTAADGGLVLAHYRLTELLADPAADASRHSQMRVAIADMLQAMHLGGGRVNYTVPAQSVFTRFVKLPPVDPDKVDQIIQFEAQQNVPFPINEVVWDYQLVGSGEDRLEVVLVAIKSDLLEDLNEAVEDSGLKTAVVDVAPMALYNAFRYNYSDLSGCSLLVDIGSRTTNLIFIEPGKVFSRSIPIGGSTITAAIAKDFSEPFGAAEERKRRDGFVSLGGAYAEPADPDVARVSKMIRNTMTRLHAEISRSISFYRTQQNGGQPVQLYLAGGSASMPYMREFFQEKLQVPIEFFNPLRNVAVGSALNVEEVGRSAHVLGELVGLSLRGLTESPMELSLRPASVIEAEKAASRRPYFVLAGICVLLILTGWWLYYTKATEVKSAVLDKLHPAVAELERQQNRLQAVQKEITAANQLAQPFLEAVAQREYWLRVINDVNSRLPERFIWVTHFEPAYFSPDARQAPVPVFPAGERTAAAKVPENATYGVLLRGLYLGNPPNTNPSPIAVVDEFLKRLAESPYFDIDLSKRAEINPVRQGQEPASWAFDYEFRLKLKDPVIK